MIADHLRRLRYFLRDPDGKIWGDALILETLNDVAQDLQWRTSLLADVRVQQVPPYWQISYQQEFERAFLGTSRLAYRMGWHHANQWTATHRWEVLEAMEMREAGMDDADVVTEDYYRVTDEDDVRVVASGDSRRWR